MAKKWQDFKQKLVKIGNSYFFLVPSFLIKNYSMEEGEEYCVKVCVNNGGENNGTNGKETPSSNCEL